MNDVEVNELYLTTTIIRRIRGSSTIGCATGFFYEDNSRLFLVTNKHVIYGDNYSIPGAVPEIDKMVIILHTNKANLRENKECELNLLKDGKPVWIEHENPAIDVVLIPIEIDISLYLLVKVTKDIFDWSDIKVDVAERIFVIGYPYAWYDGLHNLPIVRVGHLSSPFMVGFQGNSYMLGDVETHRGMSGSPVFMKIHNFYTKSGSIKLGSWVLRLVGIYSGQPIWKLPDATEVPHSLSVIWFADLIDEIAKRVPQQ